MKAKKLWSQKNLLKSLSRHGLKTSCSGGVVLDGFQVTTMFNLNPSCIELSWVEVGLGFDNYIKLLKAILSKIVEANKI